MQPVSAGLMLLVPLFLAGAAPDPPELEHLPERVDVDVVQGAYTTLTAIYDQDLRSNLVPGEIARWDVGVQVDPPDPGSVLLGVAADGDFAVELTVYSCPEPWLDAPGNPILPRENACSGDVELVVENHPVQPDGNVAWIGSFPTDQQRWLRVLTWMPLDTPDEAQNSQTTVRVHASGTSDTPGDDPAPDPSDPADPGISIAPGDGEAGDLSAGAPASPRPGALAQTGWQLALVLGLALASTLLGWILLKSRHREAG
ncbi:hypothetical protein [Nesterenkonia flava]|uniref:Peptidase n=1 Tax=Nesterenkonia flava TaxID=469799 RepID=A0ABU1FV86_9MICC|nr:hypothetical protein [Nesterenkonia flava]MDR5712585.1 hypothetical protein [Nesterenkonia flava]